MLSLFPLLAVVFSTEEEAELIVRLRAREEAALGELYDHYGKTAYSVILRVVRRPETAEDLVQETFLRVWTRIGTYNVQRGTLYTWILTIARHLAIDYTRTALGQGREQAADLDVIERVLFADPESAVRQSVNSRLVVAALEKLDPRYRQLVELAYFDGMSHSELAEKLQLPLGTVKTWLRAALQQLRQDLAGSPAV